ncbi:MAG: hypothetical protein RBS13_02495 [Bacteroidales bacterium]|nr:hypothetical protein [Bacteroidales bacterium]
MKNKFSILSLLIIAIFYIFYVSNTKRYKTPERIIAMDVLSYYGYLPAIFIEKDYTLKDWKNEEPWNNRYWPLQLENNNFLIKTTMGVSIMYAPFFFITHIFSTTLGYEANGFTQPYALALIISAMFYVFLGMFFLRKLLLSYYNDLITGITLLMIGLSTNLFWYTTAEAPMSHSYSFALFCLFIYFTDKWHKNQNVKYAIFLGFSFGLLSLIRPTNAIIVFVFLLYGITNKKNIIYKAKLFLSKYKSIIIILIAKFLIWIPQFLYWKSITGHFLFYSYANNEKFFFNDPKIIQVLFSFRKGWLIYTPSMIFALIGMFWLRKYNKQYLWGIVIFLIVNIYIVSSWWCWWFGGGFGMRAFVESYALLSIPLAAYLSQIFSLNKKMKILMLCLTTIITLQSAFHTIQFHYKTIHYEAMTKKAYIDSFWKIKPSKEYNSYLIHPNYTEAQKGNR